ncbi:MAG: TonB family protein, partial [Proteobacteria bacterium]|nr:TonB family protein [Pseudomonadota bacterium]
LENEEEGIVKVRMVLDPSGHLAESVLAGSSGFARLDSAALETLRKIGKFPVPAGHAGNLSLLVPIEYRINP